MKKVVLCVLLVGIILCPLFAKLELGLDAGSGCEVFIMEKLYPALSFNADAEIPNFNIDEKNDIALVAGYDHIMRSVTRERTNIIDSDRVTLGIKYSYKFKEKLALSVKAAGGLWFFDYSDYKFACTVVHSLGLSLTAELNEHIAFEFPVSFSTASFGNSINASIILNVK